MAESSRTLQTSKRSVLVIDDHQLFMDCVVFSLSSQPGMTVYCVKDIEGAVNHIRKHGSPDLVLLDYFLPGVVGLDGSTRLLELDLGLRICYISGSINLFIYRIIRASSAIGILSKDARLGKFVEQIKVLLDGGSIYEQSRDILSELDEENEQKIGLSANETCLLSQLRTGKTDVELAEVMKDSVPLLKKRLRVLYAKLGVSNRTAAALLWDDYLKRRAKRAKKEGGL